jgi:aminoglycoside 2'-N-acetyltransferase I
VAELRTAHTWELSAETLSTTRAFLEQVFDDNWFEHDWDHTIGGIHAMVWENDQLVAHAAVVQRRITYGGQALRAGYVESVGVHPDHRRRGHGNAVMSAVETVIRGAYELGALSASEQAAPMYAARGWQGWQGPSFAYTPNGTLRVEDEDIFVLPVTVELDPRGPITCDWRGGEFW